MAEDILQTLNETEVESLSAEATNKPVWGRTVHSKELMSACVSVTGLSDVPKINHLIPVNGNHNQDSMLIKGDIHYKGARMYCVRRMQ